jgi:hypothetical protein
MSCRIETAPGTGVIVATAIALRLRHIEATPPPSRSHAFLNISL